MSSEVTVKQLATTVGIPVERLLAQLHEAGVPASAEDAPITENQKLQLLNYLRRSHAPKGAGEEPAPIRKGAEPRPTVGGGRGGPGGRPAPSRPNPNAAPRAGKTVAVEVRRKRTFVKEPEPAPVAPAVRPAPPPRPAARADTPPPQAVAATPPPEPERPVEAPPEPVAAAPIAEVAVPQPAAAAVTPAEVATPPVTASPGPVTGPSVRAPERAPAGGGRSVPPARPGPPLRGADARGAGPRPAAGRPATAGRQPPGRPTPGRAAPGRSLMDEARRRSELEARRAEEDARRLAQQEENERRAREEAARRAEEEARRRAEAEEARRAAETAAVPAPTEPEEIDSAPVSAPTPEPAPMEVPAAAPAELRRAPPPKPLPTKPLEEGEETDEERELRRRGAGKKLPERADKDKKVAKPVRGKEPLWGKVAAVVDDDEDLGGVISRPSVRRRKKAAKPQLQDKHGFQRPTAPVVREVEVPESITVAELAARMSVKAAQVVKELFKQGVMVTVNQAIDRDTAMLLVEEMGHKAVEARVQDAEDSLLAWLEEEQGQVEALPRPPVVTIMGHVDHGKTSLLDHIRRTRVAAGEAGGITQHIGAYHVETPRGTVCFLDTPGHAAFSAMRARGAKVTDLVVLVVAADDGVMPQTIEAIQHARASKVPIIVAINKIDLPSANPERVMQELLQHEVVAEEWGGDTMMVKVSAKAGLGIDELLDAILLQAEVLELRAPVKGAARGTIIESSVEKGRGPVATVLVQSGTLGVGDTIVSGCEFGRVRAMFDESGRPVKSAGPSIPVQVLGLSGAPNAGDDVISVADERRAREVAELRQERERQSRMEEQRGASLDQLFSQFKEGEQKSVNIVLKADVQGSVEAIRDALIKLGNDEVKVNVVAAGVGGIAESDANLAVTSNAILLGFNVRADAAARRVVEEKGLDLRYYSIIYELIDHVKQAISGLLSPIVTEEIIGLAEVREVFRSSKFGAIAGCMVVDGVIKRNNPIRVLRNNVVIYEGSLESLRRFKDDVAEVKAGLECGIGVKNYNDVQPGDQIEVFERTERAREL